MTREEAIKELKEDIELYIPLRGTIDDVDRDLPDGRLITALEMAIKALEQEPCEDAISRSDMLDAIGHGTTYTSEELQEIIKGMPPVHSQPKTGRWIPVSERLPEDIRPVIVTWKNNDPASYYQYIVGKHFIGVAHYLKGKWYWYSSTTEDFLAEYGRYEGEEFDEAIEVIAWIPLPEPYREDGDTE